MERPNKELNEQHLNAPEKGDYWHEMLVAIAMVLSFDGHHVVVIRNRKVNNDGQHFTKKEKMTLKQFRDWLSYTNIPGTWADVSPRLTNNTQAYYQHERG